MGEILFAIGYLKKKMQLYFIFCVIVSLVDACSRSTVVKARKSFFSLFFFIRLSYEKMSKGIMNILLNYSFNDKIFYIKNKKFRIQTPNHFIIRLNNNKLHKSYYHIFSCRYANVSSNLSNSMFFNF